MADVPCSRFSLGALCAQAAALVVLIVAYLKRDAAHAEGAYFNRSVGQDAVVVAFDSDVRPWLIAAGILTLLSASLWIAERAVRGRGRLPL